MIAFALYQVQLLHEAVLFELFGVLSGATNLVLAQILFPVHFSEPVF